MTRHADIKAVEGDKQLFINDPRPILGSKMLDHITRHLAGAAIWSARWSPWTTRTTAGTGR